MALTTLLTTVLTTTAPATAAQMNAELESSLNAAALRKSEASSYVRADVETDVLLQLKANLAQLEDMHGRMKYMMGELSYLLVKRS